MIANDTLRSVIAPVSSFDARYVNAEVLTLLHCDHLGRRFKAELLHHGLEVVLARALRTGRNDLICILRQRVSRPVMNPEAGSPPGC